MLRLLRDEQLLPARRVFDPPTRSKEAGAIAAGVAIAVALLVHVVVEARWGTNDDSAMRAIASGERYGSPSPNVTFSHYFVGQVLATLYRVSNAIPWYYLYQVLGLVLVSIAILVAAWRLTARTSDMAVAGVPLLVLGQAWFMYTIQFTQLSVLVACAGIAILISGKTERSDIAAAAVLGIAYAVRPSGMQFAVALAFPLVVSWAQLRWRRWARFSLAVGVPIVLLTIVQRIAYRSAEWAEYRVFNAVRGSLHGSSFSDTSESLSVNDIASFRMFLFLDQDVYSTENLTELAETVHDSGGWLSVSWLTGNLGTAYLWCFGLGLVGVFGAAALARARQETFLTMAASIVWGCLCISYVEATIRMPKRLLFPCLLVILLYALFVSLERPTSGRSRPSSAFWDYALFGPLAGLAVIGVLAIVSLSNSTAASRPIERANLAELKTLLPEEPVIVNWAGALQRQMTDPRSEEHFDVPSTSSGWATFSPDWYDHLDRIGVESDNLYGEIANDPSVVVVSGPRGASVVGRLNTYIEEHLSQTGAMRQSGRSDAFTVFDQLVSAELDRSAGLATARVSIGATEVNTVFEPSVFYRTSDGLCVGPVPNVPETTVMVFNEDSLVAAGGPNLLDRMRCDEAVVPGDFYINVDRAISTLAPQLARKSFVSLGYFAQGGPLQLVQDVAALRIAAPVTTWPAGQMSGPGLQVTEIAVDGTGCADLVANEVLRGTILGASHLALFAASDATVQLRVTGNRGEYRAVVSDQHLQHPVQPGRVVLKFDNVEGWSSAELQADEPVRICGLTAFQNPLEG